MKIMKTHRRKKLPNGVFRYYVEGLPSIVFYQNGSGEPDMVFIEDDFELTLYGRIVYALRGIKKIDWRITTTELTEKQYRKDIEKWEQRIMAWRIKLWTYTYNVNGKIKTSYSLVRYPGRPDIVKFTPLNKV